MYNPYPDKKREGTEQERDVLQERGKLETWTEDEAHSGDTHTRDDNIKMDFKEMCYRMDLLQYKVHWLAVLNTLINIFVS